MSEPEKKPRTSYATQIVYTAEQINDMMVKIRQLVVARKQFSVCERNGAWELSYIGAVA